ncbi:transglutaminase-like cysteine peptidase [Ferrimonas balearica]|uniref:transglutaminase-like cysteine peptidase n=1 Tax=Ferrimonas balearica TaxID=44012 RepID=UPI001C9A2B45|nr:transglutaminase-like cysteine peptidase [Ferrimonas balearica]MBY5993202.1 transglutaminase-like cysteine peptidase [Ferrimonas balearica]
MIALVLLSLPLWGDDATAKWRRYFAPQRLDALAERFGEAGRTRAQSLEAFLEAQLDEALTTEQKLERVNDYFNGYDFIDDQTHWGQADYWATPLEFVASGGGDCEDFTIAKYFALRVLGVPAAEMRLMYAKSVTLNQAHMVLIFLERPGAMPRVLDNLDGTIKLGSERPDLVPVYSFNGEGLWRARAFDSGVRLKSGESGVDLWQDLVSRMTIEAE